MMEGAYYQQKTGNPKVLAVVVLMHGAALTALAMAKGETIRHIWNPPIVVDTIPEDQPPPPEIKPVEKEVTPPKDVITHFPPVVPTQPRDTLVISDPLPPLKQVVIAEPERVVVPTADPPPAKIEPRTVEPARAKANLASYVSDEDYPSNAVRNEEQGTTRFKLTVGPDGRVKECSVTGSSGSSALDSTTCRLMKQRARFTPARNNKGEPTGDTVANAIRWVLPAD
ncbi:MAG: periplasmic protein TonB [Sphingomonadales bacterium]|jgi:protein TonB|nr:periplasmic protein TonB [Sphingomonadales bacterium]